VDFWLPGGVILLSASKVFDLTCVGDWLIECHCHRRWHPEPQFVLRIAGIDTDLVHELIIRENTGNYRDFGGLGVELGPNKSCLPSGF
jgi:hypothetical protein